ncbi:DUF2760 domain-containing protein [Chromatium okenii]|jgi:hypothetical protein|uniref:DUF2760 domain-containing protein n=1 Tax=Chromatium okenii TaxID=61644 RepID=A0A2S7XUE3_9GAMM|nr:DUF2760 domain-containing protein [Chromatium okenii]PQJ97364.1 DUF2760 domain-containing protein [Chromatium okenii]
MTTAAPSVFRRTLIAFGSFRRIFKDPDFAQAVAQLATDDDISPPASVVAPAPAAIPLATAAPDAALLLLGLLQREGRLVDFLHENIQSYSDQEVGAAARVVHHGCQRVLNEYLTITPVRDELEGSRVTLQRGFDASAIRPTGQVVGEPPFTGTLLHRGWRVAETRLPQLTSTHDLRILAAAEVEL